MTVTVTITIIVNTWYWFYKLPLLCNSQSPHFFFNIIINIILVVFQSRDLQFFSGLRVNQPVCTFCCCQWFHRCSRQGDRSDEEHRRQVAWAGRDRQGGVDSQGRRRQGQVCACVSAYACLNVENGKLRFIFFYRLKYKTDIQHLNMKAHFSMTQAKKSFTLILLVGWIYIWLFCFIWFARWLIKLLIDRPSHQPSYATTKLFLDQSKICSW